MIMIIIIAIVIIIIIYIYIYRERERVISTVGSRKFDSQDFESRASNPTSEYVEPCAGPWQTQHLSREMYACENSKPQGSGRRFETSIFRKWPYDWIARASLPFHSPMD